MSPISPTTFACVYLFPIPAIEMVCTRRAVTVVHVSEGQPDEVVATIEPQHYRAAAYAHSFVRKRGCSPIIFRNPCEAV